MRMVFIIDNKIMSTSARLDGKGAIEGQLGDLGVSVGDIEVVSSIPDGITIPVVNWNRLSVQDQSVLTTSEVTFQKVTAASAVVPSIDRSTAGSLVIGGATATSVQVGRDGAYVSIPDTSAATGAGTGALRVAGGVMISGNIYTGANIGFTASGGTIVPSVAGTIVTAGDAASEDLTLRSTSHGTKGKVKIDETTAATSTTTGALVVSGGLGLAGSAYIGGSSYFTRDYGQWTYTRTEGTHGGSTVGDENWGTGSAVTLLANYYGRHPISETEKSVSWCTFTASGTGTNTTAGSWLLDAGTYRMDFKCNDLYATQRCMVFSSQASSHFAKASISSIDIYVRSVNSYSGHSTDPGDSDFQMDGIFTLSSQTRLYVLKMCTFVTTYYGFGIAMSSGIGTELHARMTMEKLS